MREVRAHRDRPLLRRGRRVRFDIAIARRVVERLVEPVASVEAGLGERLEILRRGRRRHEARQGRGVRRDDEIRGQAALQAKARHAEGAILVVALAIGEGIRGFRNAPRHATLPAVLDLAAHARAAALIEQCAGEAAHQQLRHQVLEHRAAPRHQRGASIDVGHQPAKVEPVVLRDVTLGDRHEAGEPCLRGEEVVEGAIEPSGTVGILQAVADGENPAPAVVQKIEAHAVGHCRHARRQRLDRGGRQRRGFRERRGAVEHRSAPVPDVALRLPVRRLTGVGERACELRGELLRFVDGAIGRRRSRQRRDGAREPVDLGHDRARAEIAFADDDAWARSMAASASPSSRCSCVCGFCSSSSRPCASVMSAPARLPLSTVETYRGCNGARVDVSYQFRK